MSVLAASLSVCFALLSWLANPTACCPRDSVQMPACQDEACMNSGEMQTACAMDNCDGASQLASADSLLNKSGAAGSLNTHSFLIQRVLLSPDTQDFQTIVFEEKVQTESAFIALAKPPPRG